MRKPGEWRFKGKERADAKAFYACGDASKRKCPFCKQWDYPTAMRHIHGETYQHKACERKYHIDYVALKEKRVAVMAAVFPQPRVQPYLKP